MTKLDCSVKNCVHNSDNCCCKEAIVVDGCKAKECCETCCGSFSENDGGMFKNLFKTPEKSLKIDCEAVNCKHNEDHRCTAGHVGITGDGASEAEQTECATFEMREADERKPGTGSVQEYDLWIAGSRQKMMFVNQILYAIMLEMSLMLRDGTSP